MILSLCLKMVEAVTMAMTFTWRLLDIFIEKSRKASARIASPARTAIVALVMVAFMRVSPRC